MRDKFTLTNCVLTNLEIEDHEAQRTTDFTKPKAVYYRVFFEDRNVYLGICTKLFDILTIDIDQLSPESQSIKKELKKYLPIYLHNHFKTNFRNFFNLTIHWNCDVEEPDHRHESIKPVVDKLIEEGFTKYTRKQKSKLLISKIYESQTFEGEKVNILNDYQIWSELQFGSKAEFEFYCSQLESQKLLKVEDELVQLTFEGLEFYEGLSHEAESMQSEVFQIGLSFAGEERSYVHKVASYLKSQGIKVFYDDFETVELWGKDLYQYLNDIYKNKCEYCIMFLSESYANKLWTKHELKSAQVKAFKENKEYILPVRFDDTEIPGINETVGYIDGRKKISN